MEMIRDTKGSQAQLAAETITAEEEAEDEGKDEDEDVVVGHLGSTQSLQFSALSALECTFV